MQIYKSRFGRLSGTASEVVAQARREYRAIQKITPRRRPYVRSRYFKRNKVFVGIFWQHLAQKQKNEQTRRLAFYRCAIDLLRNTTIKPETTLDAKKPGDTLYRFYGMSKDGLCFCAQVKRNESGRKDFISVFQIKRPKK